MKRSSFFTLYLLATIVLLNAVGMSQSPAAKDAKNAPYKVGQMWTYETRPNEAGSVFVIVKIDRDPKFGNIVHIAVSGLKMKNPRSSDGSSDKIGHMPFSEKAIDASGVKLLKEKVNVPDFQQGYDLWREAFDQGQAGFYTVTIAEAVKIAEAGLNR